MTMDEKLAINGGPKAITYDQEEALKWPRLTEEDEKAVVSLMRKNEISVSEEPMKLEKEFGQYLGAEYALAEVNGTSALYAALFALGIGEGDEVICPSYTYWASAMPAATLGAKVVFCEVNPDSLNIDPEDFKKRITPRTKAVIPVHLWGLPCEMDEITGVAKEHGIAVVEDACHAHGAEYRGKKMGTIGDIGIFSFQASKNLPAGEGGMMVTANRDYFYKAVTLGHYRRAADLPEEYSRYQHTSFGYKHRMSPLHAAIARVQLKTLDEKNRIRNDNVEKLLQALDGIPGFHIYRPPEYIRRVYYENDVVYREEETGVSMSKLIEMLKAEGAIVRQDRYPLLHQQPYFTEKGSNPEDLPVTREIREHVLALPTFPGDDGTLVEQYITAFRKVFSLS
ncbi:MAG: DegT/DnrJ/EryC1/StrS family aminotransferase [Spirochaetales bacterium]|nr:DegT/DnrJ/EryC1/StrS family aminotransferase [Spirochaetales bacterium]